MYAYIIYMMHIFLYDRIYNYCTCFVRYTRSNLFLGISVPVYTYRKYFFIRGVYYFIYYDSYILRINIYSYYKIFTFLYFFVQKKFTFNATHSSLFSFRTYLFYTAIFILIDLCGLYPISSKSSYLKSSISVIVLLKRNFGNGLGTRSSCGFNGST